MDRSFRTLFWAETCAWAARNGACQRSQSLQECYPPYSICVSWTALGAAGPSGHLRDIVLAVFQTHLGPFTCVHPSFRVLLTLTADR